MKDYKILDEDKKESKRHAEQRRSVKRRREGEKCGVRA